MGPRFPPDAPWRVGQSESGLLLSWLCVLLPVALVIGVIFKWRSELRRNVRRADLWIGFAGLWVIPFVAITLLKFFSYYHLPFAQAPFPRADRFIAACFRVSWLVVLGGMLTATVRLWRKNDRAPVIGLMASCGIFVVLYAVWALRPRQSMARPAARRSQCRNNLKQIGLSIASHVDRHGTYPLPSTGNPPVSWRVDLFLTPEFGNPPEYDRSKPWDDAVNEPAAKATLLDVLLCPSSPRIKDDQKRAFAHYVMVTGNGTIAPGNKLVSPEDITDGVSQTIVGTEAVGLNVVWTEPRDFNVDRQPIGVNLPGMGTTDSPGMLSSYHAGGAHVVLADGSVRFISEAIDRDVLKALTTIDRGEQIPGF